MNLWPVPRTFIRDSGEVPVPDRVVLAAPAEWTDVLLQRLSWLRPHVGGSTGLAVAVVRDETLPREAFRLDVDRERGVRITAGSIDGAGHATVTLRQLLPADAHRRAPLHRAGWRLPVMTIEDQPAFEWRGFMLDVSRYFTPKDEIFQLIEHLSLHRVNRLHMHLTDDPGWRVESRAFPRLTEIGTWRPASPHGMTGFDEAGPELDGTPHGGYYTLDDLREITAFAKAHGIVVVPEIDLPAHASALLAGIPELTVPGTPVPEVSTSFRPSGRVVSPLPEAREILATLLAEVAGAVDSPYLHIGGDEASLADWERSPQVAAYARSRGLAGVGDLRADLTAFLVETCGQLGRRAIVWDEAFYGGGLRPDTIVMAWRHESHGHHALAAGHDVVMAPIPGNYLDYNDDGPDEPLALGGGQTIGKVAAYSPTRPDGGGALLGTQACLWSEFVPDKRLRAYRIWPRLCVHAANGWTGKPTPWPQHRGALEAHLGRLTAAGVEYRPLDGPLPWQRGGTGARRATSPLTVDKAVQVVELMSQNNGRLDPEAIRRLLTGT